MPQDRVEPQGFRFGDPAAEGCDPVITPPCRVTFGLGRRIVPVIMTSA